MLAVRTDGKQQRVLPCLLLLLFLLGVSLGRRRRKSRAAAPRSRRKRTHRTHARTPLVKVDRKFGADILERNNARTFFSFSSRGVLVSSSFLSLSRAILRAFAILRRPFSRARTFVPSSSRDKVIGFCVPSFFPILFFFFLGTCKGGIASFRLREDSCLEKSRLFELSLRCLHFKRDFDDDDDVEEKKPHPRKDGNSTTTTTTTNNRARKQRR